MISTPISDQTMSEDPKQILSSAAALQVSTPRATWRSSYEEASITLINRENYWVYQSMLPDELDPKMRQ